MENKIADIETRQKELETKMALPENYDASQPAVRDLLFKHSELQRELDRYMEEWENLVEE